MSMVADILKHKAIKEIYAIAPDATVFDAISVMADKGIGALPVMSNSVLVGILSERDYTRKVALKDRASKTTLVKDIMVSDVISVTPHTKIDDCLQLMTDKRIRHLPVLENNTVVGFLSIGDLVKYTIMVQKQQIEQLHGYISG